MSKAQSQSRAPLRSELRCESVYSSSHAFATSREFIDPLFDFDTGESLELPVGSRRLRPVSRARREWLARLLDRHPARYPLFRPPSQGAVQARVTLYRSRCKQRERLCRMNSVSWRTLSWVFRTSLDRSGIPVVRELKRFSFLQPNPPGRLGKQR